MSDFPSVLAYVATQATDQEIRQLFDAGNARLKILRQVAAAQVSAQLREGETRVRVARIRPKRLEGARGLLMSIETTGRKQTASIQLDHPTSYLQDTFGSGLLTGIPLSCLDVLA